MSATAETTPTFTAVTVKHSPGREVEWADVTIAAPPAWIVYGGEYPEDLPDVLVTVNHAVNEDGEDIAHDVARAIAAVLGWHPMTTTDLRPTAEQTRQRYTTSVVLSTGLAPVAEPIHRYPDSPPIATVDVMDGLRIQSSDPDTLRDLADALLTAAAELHAARDEWREANGL